jgi:hypothetical protein
MRSLQAIAILLVVLPFSAHAQAPFGGCAQGTELGYVRVNAKSELTEWDSGKRVADAMPGDELRLCRFEGRRAVVTLWAEGYGYFIVRANLDAVRPPLRQQVTSGQRACIYRDILSVQSSLDARRQGEAFLRVARNRAVTIVTIKALRDDLTATLAQDRSSSSIAQCAPEAAVSGGSREPTAGISAERTRKLRLFAFDVADSAMLYGSRTLGQSSPETAMTAIYYIGLADGVLTAVKPDSINDPGGTRVWNLVSEYVSRILPEIARIGSGEHRSTQTVIAPLATWFQIARVQIGVERARPY